MDIAEDDLEKIIIRNITNNKEIDNQDSYRMLSEVI